MKSEKKNYFFKSFATILLAVVAFVVLKEYLPVRLFPETNSNIDGVIAIDSMALVAIANADTLKIDSVAFSASESSDSLIVDSLNQVDGSEVPDVYISSSKDAEGFGNLANFYEKLYQLETLGKGRVRIAYFGDSMTDGDMIVQDVRAAYQNEFGGKGVGFVGITSLSASARASVTHQYSKSWITQSFLKIKKPRRAFGIDGNVSFVPTDGRAWVSYTSGSRKNSTSLYNPTLFYGSSSNKNGSVSVVINKDSIINLSLSPDKIINTLQLTSSAQSVKATFEQVDSIPFYGVNIDDGKGVHVDNFSLRGNSGLPLSMFSTRLMNALDRELNYSLIILQYGTNVLGYGTKDYTWYENKMSTVVRHLRACFPHAEIVVVSTGDRALKYNMEMKTDEAVKPLVKHQRLYAEKTHCAFVNLFTLMGGEGSMLEWVSQDPPLANKDYTHFNQRGAKKVGSLIYNELNRGYLEYKVLRESGQIPSKI